MVDNLKLDYEGALELAARGASLKLIAERLGCSPVYMSKVLAQHAPFRQAMEQARIVGFSITADEVKTLVPDNPLLDPNLIRIHADNLKWYLSKMHPAVFGEKLDMTISKQVDIGSAIQEGRARTRIVNAPLVSDGANDPFAD